MPYSPHTLVAFVGGWSPAALASEVWQFGIRVSVGGPAGYYVSDCQAYADAIATAVSTWFSSASNFMSNQAVLKSIKVNNINPSGHYVDPTTHQHDFATPVAGGVASSWTCFNTVAISFTTAIARGRAHTGRIYPPVTGLALADPGHLSTAAQSALVTTGKALLSILLRNDASGHLVSPVIESRVDASSQPIIGVRVGSVPDVQRRRKAQLTETYSSSVWP